MTDLAPAPLRARLPRLDPDRARAQNRALEVLSTLAVQHEGAPLQVDVMVRDGPPGGAFVFAAPPGWLSVAPEVVDGAAAPPLDPARDLTAALSALGRLEPVLAALERAGACSLEPLGVETGPRRGALSLGLRLHDAGGRLVHALAVDVSLELARSWPAPSAPLRRLGAAETAGVACRLMADGPKLDRGALAGLTTGALLLLPRTSADGWPARFGPAEGRIFARGWIEWPSSRFTQSAFEDGPMLDRPPEDASVVESSDTRHAGEGFPVDSLPVAVRVAVDGVRTSVGELARLQPGSTLVLPDLGDSPRVTVLADDRPVAEGRLVSLGEAYGVLIERVNA